MWQPFSRCQLSYGHCSHLLSLYGQTSGKVSLCGAPASLGLLRSLLNSASAIRQHFTTEPVLATFTSTCLALLVASGIPHSLPWNPLQCSRTPKCAPYVPPLPRVPSSLPLPHILPRDPMDHCPTTDDSHIQNSGPGPLSQWTSEYLHWEVSLLNSMCPKLPYIIFLPRNLLFHLYFLLVISSFPRSS